jgi:DNA-binding IclR family transcriptional regulator
MEAVTKVRRDGYLFDLNTWTAGLGAVSAPIPGKAGTGQNMALTVAGAVPRLQLSSKKIIPAVKAAARQLTEQVGRQPQPAAERALRVR